LVQFRASDDCRPKRIRDYDWKYADDNGPIRIKLFDAYLTNAVKTQHRSLGNTSIPCPLCLESIERAAVFAGTVVEEHIVPQHATTENKQQTPDTQMGFKNTRSGLTLTCSNCNRFKGKHLDFPLRGLVAPTRQREDDYTFETGTAILIHAYLFAFAILGYEYVYCPELEEVRRQFHEPSVRHSAWLEHAHVNLNPPTPIVATQSGYPCVFGRPVGQPMQVFWWRFRASLPNADFVMYPVDVPTLLSELIK